MDLLQMLAVFALIFMLLVYFLYKNKLSSAQSDFIDKLVPDQPFHPTDLDMDFGD